MSTQANPHLDLVLKIGQDCLSRVPVTVLGSGASLAYGVGGMGELQEHLFREVKPESGEDAVWQQFLEALTSTKDLEKSLHVVRLTETLERKVVAATRCLILRGDRAALQRIISNELVAAHSMLFRRLLNSTHQTITVVTTNYDRLAEYATDAAGLAHHTGFQGTYYRRFQAGTLSGSAPRASTHKQVEVLKVHGSLDWFGNESDDCVSIPDDATAPDGFSPLMVTPGTGKYQATHFDPFRSIITRSDSAFASARSIFCVGYGFRDRHIQPKLTRRVMDDGVPVVVLGRTLTDEARAFLKSCRHATALGLEQSGAGTKAYLPGYPDGVQIEEAIWSFEDFLRIIF